MNILICRILKAVHYRVFKCTAILHTPMGRTHGENSMSKADNDAKRVANTGTKLYGIIFDNITWKTRRHGMLKIHAWRGKHQGWNANKNKKWENRLLLNLYRGVYSIRLGHVCACAVWWWDLIGVRVQVVRVQVCYELRGLIRYCSCIIRYSATDLKSTCK